MFELRETGDWDIFLDPPERARAETGGADQCLLKRRKFPGFAIMNDKKRPHPWDTHYLFSINTLLSKDWRKKRREICGWRTCGQCGWGGQNEPKLHEVHALRCPRILKQNFPTFGTVITVANNQ
jgi:hypothetical protein